MKKKNSSKPTKRNSHFEIESSGFKFTFGYITFALLIFAVPDIAAAAPMLERFVGSGNVISQFVAILVASLGGVGYSLKDKLDSPVPPIVKWSFISVCLLSAVMVIAFSRYHFNQIELQDKRLRANLIKPDTSNPLPLSEQKDDPLGVSTVQLSAWISAGEPLNIIDLREPEEVEFGILPKSLHIRYADLKKNTEKVSVSDVKTIFVSFSGIRSGEIAREISTLGKEVSYLVGGLEKWISEGRELSLRTDNAVDLRAIENYENSSRLLTTPEVEDLYYEDDAIFVDVRTRSEFNSGHLPEAVNLPFWELDSQSLNSILESLPIEKAIVAPCYNRSSCFYAKILGLKLDRRGYDFEGRYTVPHEFVIQVSENQPVLNIWETAADDSIPGTLEKPIRSTLKYLDREFGNLGISIVMISILFGLLMFPFRAKGEWDSLSAKARAPKVRQLRYKIRHDQVKLKQALKDLVKTDYPTPIFNLVVGGVYLVLFVALFKVIQDVSSDSVLQEFLGFLLSEPDPFFLLPLLVAAAVYYRVKRTYILDNQWGQPIAVAVAFVAVAAAALLPFGTNLFLLSTLLVSIGFQYVVETLYHKFKLLWDERKGKSIDLKKIKMKSDGVLPLHQVYPGFGGGHNSENLADLMRAGFPVLPGFAISSELLKGQNLSKESKRIIKQAWSELGADKVIVNCSAVAKNRKAETAVQKVNDLEKIVNVTLDNLFDTIDYIRENFDKVQSQLNKRAKIKPAIAVQKMVNADYSGVLYREDPVTSGSCVVELYNGIPESKITESAMGNVQAYRFGRYSGQAYPGDRPPIDLAPLLELGKSVEKHFDKQSQDIEFAFSQGRFFLVQTRQSKRNGRQLNSARNYIERERRRLCEMYRSQNADTVVLQRVEDVNLRSKPSRFTLSLFNRLWSPGGPISKARQVIGLPDIASKDYQNLLITAFGTLYTSRGSRVSKEGRKKEEQLGALVVLRLSKATDQIERAFRKDFLPDHLYQIKIRKSIQFNQLALHDLVNLAREWIEDYISRTYIQLATIEIACFYYDRTAVKALNVKPEEANDIIYKGLETAETYANKLLGLIKRGDLTEQAFLEHFGYRSEYDFELAHPSYQENLDDILDRIDLEEMESASSEDNENPEHSWTEAQKVLIDRARRFKDLLVDAKHYSMISLRQIRPLLLQIESHLGLPKNQIFNLSLSEIFRLSDSSFVQEVEALVSRRREEVAQFSDLVTPKEFTLRSLETYGIDPEQLALSSVSSMIDASEEGEASEEEGQVENINSPVQVTKELLHGVPAYLRGEVAGRARVISSPEEIDLFQQGEILVAPTTNPAWSPLFSLAAGVIAEFDGLTGHAAMMAREQKIPTIVKVGGAIQSINTGDLIRMMEDGTIEIGHPTRRTAERYPMSRRVLLHASNEWVKATIVNLSITGALVEIDPKDKTSINYGSTGSFSIFDGEGNVDYTIHLRGERQAVLHFVRPLTVGEFRYLSRRQDDRHVVNRPVSIMLDDEYLTLPLINISRGGGLIRLDTQWAEWAAQQNHDFKGQLILDGFSDPIDFTSGRRMANNYVVFFSSRLSHLKLKSFLETTKDDVKSA